MRFVLHRERVRQRDRARRRSSEGATVRGVIGMSNVPDSILFASSLPDADYADVFTLSPHLDASPEQWARATLGDIPTPGERLIWRGLLGLRLSRGRSPNAVAGWLIAECGDHWIRLEAGSWFLSGNLIVRTADGRMSLATFVRYDRGIARLIWPPLAAVHRRAVPALLRGAAEFRAGRRAIGSMSQAGSSAQRA
jgi:hypothetical protein